MPGNSMTHHHILIQSDKGHPSSEGMGSWVLQHVSLLNSLHVLARTFATVHATSGRMYSGIIAVEAQACLVN